MLQLLRRTRHHTRHHTRWDLSPSLRTSRHYATVGTHTFPIKCAVKETPTSEACISTSNCYDSDKVVVDTLCPFMYPTRLMVGASNVAVRQEKLRGSHALYLVVVAMYMTKLLRLGIPIVRPG